MFWKLWVIVYTCLVFLVDSTSFAEYNSLVDFYNATNGNTWVNNSGWNSLASISNYSTVCVSIFPFGLNCSLAGHITSIKFNETNGNNLTGTIPNSFLNLSYLTTISFSNEINLFGTIPSSMFEIKNITIFQLSNVGISGIISNKIGNWNKLEILSIISTNITQFPTNTSIFKNFTNLKVLYFNSNPYLKNIKLNNNICQLKSIIQLTLTDIGHMEGILAPCIGNNLTNLTSFTLGASDQYDIIYNYPNITGLIPITMSKLENLHSIVIKRTGLYGEIFTKPKRLPFENLYDLRIPYNLFSGTLDPNIVCLMTLDIGYQYNNPYFFRIGHNYFNGTLPNCLINNWFNQSYNISNYYRQRSIMIFMYNNLFSGTFPNDNDITVSKNCYITEFVLYSNLFHGQLPKWLTKCQFYGIELQSNQLNGTLPNGFNTAYFDISSNHKLTGTIPYGLIVPTTYNNNYYNDSYCNVAKYVLMGYCDLYGQIPIDLINLPCLIELNLHYNRLTSIENNTEISNPFLENLRLNDNQLYINNIGIFLKYLFYINNNINLKIIELHENNGITGDLSKWDKINNTKHIDLLTLHDCNIYGSLSKELKISIVNRFTLFNNRLSCDIPPNFININNFSFVILGNLFTIADTKKLNSIDWINPQFTKATNLYLTNVDYYKEIICCIVGLIAGLLLWIISILKIKSKYNYCFDWLFKKCCICCCIYKNNISKKQLKFKYKRKSTHTSRLTINRRTTHHSRFNTNTNTNITDIEFLQENITDYIALFLQSIEKLLTMFSNIFLLFMACMLTLLYFMNSTYYQCGHVTSQISLTYLHFIDDAQTYTLSMVLTIVISLILFNAFCLYQLLSICFYFTKNKNKTHSQNNKTDHKSKSHNKGMFFTSNSNTENLISNDDTHIDDSGLGYENNLTDASIIGTIDTMVDYSTLVDQCYIRLSFQKGVIYRICSFIIYSSLYCCGIVLSIIYIIISDLPTDNVLHLNYEWQIEMIHSSLAFILTLINIYIAPKFVDSIINLILIFDCNTYYNYNYNYNNLNCISKCIKYIWKLLFTRRSDMIAIFRSILSIFIPLFASIIYLNKCGNYWTHLWYPCRKELLTFKTNIIMATFFGPNGDISYATSKLTILENHDVCHTAKKFDDISISPCLRRYLQIWIPVITLKLIITTINPHILYFIKIKSIDNKIIKVFNNCKKKLYSILSILLFCNYNSYCNNKKKETKLKRNKNNNNNNNNKNMNGKYVNNIEYYRNLNSIETIDIDIECAMFATKLEFGIIFGFISPFLLFIIGLAMYSNYYVFAKLYQSNRLLLPSVKNLDENNLNIIWKLSKFPFIILFVAIGVEQILLSKFLTAAFSDYQTVMFVMIVILVLMDIVSITFLIIFKIRNWKR